MFSLSVIRPSGLSEQVSPCWIALDIWSWIPSHCHAQSVNLILNAWFVKRGEVDVACLRHSKITGKRKK